MPIEIVGGVIILWMIFGTLTGGAIYGLNDDLTGPEVIVIGLVWPLSIIAIVVIGAIRVVRRFDLL